MYIYISIYIVVNCLAPKSCAGTFDSNHFWVAFFREVLLSMTFVFQISWFLAGNLEYLQ